MIPYEDLSRLLNGELDDEVSAALRERIRTEPDVARAWASMTTLVDDLEDLPQAAPPVHLDAAVLGESRRSPPVPAPANTRGLRVAMAVGAALVAATLVLSWRVTPPPVLHVVASDELVDGSVAVMAAGRHVDIDGLARITVEPAVGVLREWEPDQEDPMNRTAVLSAAIAAAAGAVLTVAVYEGTATIADPGASPVVLEAGDTQRMGPTTTTATGSSRIPPARPLPAGATQAQTIAHLKERIDELEGALSRSEFTGAIAQGQLVAHVGAPQAWPEDVAEGLQPDAFSEHLEAAVEAFEGAEVAEIDCSEYPCIAVLELTELTEDWADRLGAVPEKMAEDFGEDMGLSVMGMGFEDDDSEAALLGFVFAPEGDTARDSEVGSRSHYRANELMQEMGRSRLAQGSEE